MNALASDGRRRRRGRAAWIVAAVLVAVYAGSSLADYGKRTDVLGYVDELVAQHGFDRAALLSWFEAAERQERILEAIARPAERVKSWGEYRAIFLTSRRIEQGVEFWRQHESSLARAADEYRVAPEVVVAILGVETSYGRITGSFRVLDALVTLGFDYPPRAPFFRGELTQFFLLTREENRSPLDFSGSYAGAMGYGQFIPSSYRAYAVDFDGDGRRGHLEERGRRGGERRQLLPASRLARRRARSGACGGRGRPRGHRCQRWARAELRCGGTCGGWASGSTR